MVRVVIWLQVEDYGDCNRKYRSVADGILRIIWAEYICIDI